MTTRALTLDALRSMSVELAAQPSPALFSLHRKRGYIQSVREFDLEMPEDLLGYTAPASWSGVALVFQGHAFEPEREAARSTTERVGTALSIDRAGAYRIGLHSFLSGQTLATSEDPAGLITDIAHRILGLDTPAEARGPEHLIIGEWLHAILDLAADPRTSAMVDSIQQIVELHPGMEIFDPTSSRPTPPPSDIAAMTQLAARVWPWERLRKATMAELIRFDDLTSKEAAWMDEAFFARWSLAVHRPVTTVLDDLSLFLDGQTLAYLHSAVLAPRWLGFADDPPCASTGDE